MTESLTTIEDPSHGTVQFVEGLTVESFGLANQSLIFLQMMYTEDRIRNFFGRVAPYLKHETFIEIVSESEAAEGIDLVTWGTIKTIDDDGTPTAIVTYHVLQGGESNKPMVEALFDSIDSKLIHEAEVQDKRLDHLYTFNREHGLQE